MILPYDPLAHYHQLVELLQRSLPEKWQLTDNYISHFFAHPLSDAWVAMQHQQLIAFFCTSDQGRCGELLLVDPRYRRRGVAAALMAHARELERFGGNNFPFKAVPSEWTESIAFLKARAFAMQSSGNADQLLDFSTTPFIGVSDRNSWRLVRASDHESCKERIIEMVTREFLDWSNFYQTLINQGHGELILALENDDGEVAAVAMIGDRHRITSPGYQWKKFEKINLATMALFGVAKTYRGKGMAKLFLSLIIQELKKKGMDSLFINSSAAPELYAKFGAKVFAQYHYFIKDSKR